MSSKWSFLSNRNRGSDVEEANTQRKTSSVESRDGDGDVDDDVPSSQLNDRVVTGQSVSAKQTHNNNSFSLPVGLSGPNAIKFSPRISENQDERQRFISFISSYWNGTIENGKNSSSGSNSMAQKRLCAMDLGPLWQEVERRDINDAQDGQDYVTHMSMKLLDPDFVMNQFVMPVINSSLPFHRKHCRLNEALSTSMTPTGVSANMANLNSLDNVQNHQLSLEEKLRRERQRVHSNGLTEFIWGKYQGNMSQFRYERNQSSDPERGIRLIVPLGGNIYVQDGIGPHSSCPLRIVYEKSMLSEHSRTYGPAVGRDSSAIDPQLSPDGTMIAFVVGGELFVMSCEGDTSNVYGSMELHSHHDYHQKTKTTIRPTQVTFGAEIDDTIFLDNNSHNRHVEDNLRPEWNPSTEKKRFGRSISHGLADFVAQEEMDRYRGFWWNEESDGILFVRVDESCVPPFRIMHQDMETHSGGTSNYEEHRYPFAGQSNPEIALGYIDIDKDSILNSFSEEFCDDKAHEAWSKVRWFQAPDNASEYLARVDWLPGRGVCVQWQNRAQTKLILVRYDIQSGASIILHEEHSNVWINLHDMFKVLPEAIHPSFYLGISNPGDTVLPEGSFSYLFASERTGFCHLYLYTYIAGHSKATLIRAVSSGEWMVETIVGVDTRNDLIFVTGTYDSVIEKHLYMLPLKSSSSSMSATLKDSDHKIGRQIGQVLSSLKGTRKERKFNSFKYPAPIDSMTTPDPIRITSEQGMHYVTMDDTCRLVVDTCSDVNRPTTTKIYSLPKQFRFDTDATNILQLHCVIYDATKEFDPSGENRPPEILSFPTSDGTETLYAALYKPNPKDHGEGPYPLICSVYGGPHVQRVARCWTLSVDVRVQRLCSLGFAVMKCDNRGSSRRGLAFEGAIKGRLGRIEVLDQVSAVRHVVMKRIADPRRVGIYGWSYGGYLAAMCLCRAPDIFRVAISGAPVTSWDCYDTHYTERYMGLPDENRASYEESAVFGHVDNMEGKILIIHGLIDENVHFRHSARLITKLISAGKDYDLLLFPNERHSPKRLHDRIYMEKRISDFFMKYLGSARSASNADFGL